MARCLLLALMFCSLFSGISAGWGADEWSGWSSKGKGYGSYGRSSSYAGGKDGAKASPIHHRPSHLSADSLQASR